MAPPRNLDQLARVYGPATWDVYSQLDVTLNPAGPDSLHALAGEYLRPGNVVLDAGCRDARHLIRLVQENGVTGVGVDPVALHVDRARAAVSAAGLGRRIDVHLGVMQALPQPACSFDLVWCRDVVEQVDDLESGLAELRRVMKPDARLVVYTTFATDRLDGRDAEMMCRHLGTLEANLDRAHVEGAFEGADLVIERQEVIGSTWQEHLAERTQPASTALLRLSRLRRRRDEVVAAHGKEIYDHVEANLHWEVFIMLGKLEPVVYVLTKRHGFVLRARSARRTAPNMARLVIMAFCGVNVSPSVFPDARAGRPAL